MQIKDAATACPVDETSPLAVFDASHGQPNWAKTGFTSREMHTNFAGVMELLCRLGCTCRSTGREPLPPFLQRARLLVIPPGAGSYNSVKRCWTPRPESLFTAEDVWAVLNFLQNGGRLLGFAYRFGDSFTASNLRELYSPLGCLLNDDAVIDVQTLRHKDPLETYFDTPQTLIPLAWAREGVSKLRWRTMATFTILPGVNVQPLALSAGGACISFNRSLRRISFASLPLAVAGTHGRGRFVLFGGPHAFETGTYGLLPVQDNACFLQNVVRWLLDDASPALNLEAKSQPTLGPFCYNIGLDVVRGEDPHSGRQTIEYVEKVLRQTGILKALNRPKWMP